NVPPNPPSSPSTASLSRVARCWHSNAYFSLFLRYFSSTHRTNLSRFRGTFHSFDPVGFAIFATQVVRAERDGAPRARTILVAVFIARRISVASPGDANGASAPPQLPQ